MDAIEPQSLVSDPSFLNKLQADVNSWIKEIQAVTKLSRDVSSGTASQEINFWLSMENALESIEAQLKGEEVTLAMDVLKHAKRFHATVSFIADTGLKEAAELGAPAAQQLWLHHWWMRSCPGSLTSQSTSTIS